MNCSNDHRSLCGDPLPTCNGQGSPGAFDDPGGMGGKRTVGHCHRSRRSADRIAADWISLLFVCAIPQGARLVEVTRGNSWKAFPEWLQEHLAAFGQISRKEIVTNVSGLEESRCGIVIPIGVNSERGLVAAASDRPDFPDQIDQQLLSVAANNAATAFQNAFLINELRSAQEALRANEQELRKARDELEIKVAERTSELRRSERELRDVLDSIPAIVWSALPDGSNTYVNRRFVEYSGSSAEQTAGSGWQAQFTLMILSDMQVNGWKRLLPASLSKMRCVSAARMGNIAGSWTAECRSEMKMETSSSGMGS